MSDVLERHALVLGGARSGKTRAALDWAEALGPDRLYIATAEPLDDEMRDRIARHKAERGEGWRTVEAALDLPASLAASTNLDAVVVDCLTLWLSNLMHHGRDPEAEAEWLVQALGATRTPVLMVSNEVGLGLVPETKLGRAFRDAQGRLNQRIAKAVGNVVFIAAGLPLRLKGVGRYEG